MKVCSFTGHRIIPEAHKAAMPAMLERAVNFAYSEGCREFCVGGALGFDTEAAKAVIKFRMSHSDVILHVVVPCADQADSWGASHRAMYDYLIGCADRVSVLSDSYHGSCMKERNRRLAESCDIMIAYCNRYASGAGQTVKMAELAGKKVYNLYSALNSGIDRE